MSDRSYDQGFRDGVEAAAKALQQVNVSPDEAKPHFRNAGGALLHMLERGALAPKNERTGSADGDPS